MFRLTFNLKELSWYHNNYQIWYWNRPGTVKNLKFGTGTISVPSKILKLVPEPSQYSQYSQIWYKELSQYRQQSQIWYRNRLGTIEKIGTVTA